MSSRDNAGPGARRSSYASVLSGATAHQVPRSGFLAGQLEDSTAGTPLSQSYPQHGIAASAPMTSFSRSHSDDPQMLLGQAGSLAGVLGWFPDAQLPEFFIPSYLRGSKHMERLQDKYKARLQSQRDGRSARSSVAGSLSASASGVNLHKMIPSHRGMTHEIIERPYKQSREDLPLAELPSRWSASDKAAGIEVASDGSEIKFNGNTKTSDEGAAARADRPVPREVGIYYFEMDVLSKNKESHIAIGVSGSGVVLNRMPGWEQKSWAYHGDDGNCFCQTANGKSYGHKFGTTDVIGCGINFKNNSIFFTKNGVHLGTAFRDISDEPLFPAIGFKRAGEQVRVNFGQFPFVFDIDGLVRMETNALLKEIDASDIGALHSTKSKQEEAFTQELVAQYLAHDGYIETAKAFMGEAKKLHQAIGSPTDNGVTRLLEYKDDQDAVNRQRIRSAILSGDVDRALKLTNTFYPSVLQENENVYFKLRCRKFIEMMRKCTELQPSRSKRHRRRSSRTSGAASNGHKRNSSAGAGDVFDSSRMELDDDDGVISDDDVAIDDGMDLEAPDPATQAEQAGLTNEALAYGQELQSEFADDPRREVKQALEDTFALIAYPDARESSLAPLLETDGRVPVAEELNSAILVSLGKSSSAVVERMYQQSEALVSQLSASGAEGAALLNPRRAFMS